LPDSKGVGGRGKRVGESLREGERGRGGEMTQTLYAHMNKRKINK
jgi:hypothetical protein